MNAQQMAQKIRAFEQRCQQHMQEFRCPVHLCLGQEAAPAALHEVIQPDDWLFSTHRNHGHYLAKGGSEEKLWDEIMLRETGINGGWAGSQCFSDPSINFHASAIVGGLIGAAVGVALSMKLRGQKNVVVCCIGDGATEQGVFWESLNASALWELPILFVCENNNYSVHANIQERQPWFCAIDDRARAFSIRARSWHPGLCADLLSQIIGNYYADAKDGTPCLVEVHCVRECNHVGNMPDFRVGDKP